MPYMFDSTLGSDDDSEQPQQHRQGQGQPPVSPSTTTQRTSPLDILDRSLFSGGNSYGLLTREFDSAPSGGHILATAGGPVFSHQPIVQSSAFDLSDGDESDGTLLGEGSPWTQLIEESESRLSLFYHYHRYDNSYELMIPIGINYTVDFEVRPSSLSLDADDFIQDMRERGVQTDSEDDLPTISLRRELDSSPWRRGREISLDELRENEEQVIEALRTFHREVISR